MGEPPVCFQGGESPVGPVSGHVVCELRNSQHLSALLRKGSGIGTSSLNDLEVLSVGLVVGGGPTKLEAWSTHCLGFANTLLPPLPILCPRGCLA